jgi:hypothetical protein
MLKIGFIDETLAHRRIHGNNVILNSELWNKNTSIICEDALNYPWMDTRCKKVLRQELSKAYFLIGVGYLLKGNFSRSRTHFKTIMNHNNFNLLDLPRFYLKFPAKAWAMAGLSFLKGIRNFSSTD